MPTRGLLTFIGPKGGGKTTQARKFVQLHYGQGGDVLMIGEDRKDFVVMCENNFLLALDNMDHKPRWLEDELAVCATGAESVARTLYTNTKETWMDRQVFLVMTSRTPQFRREDVADRLIILKVDRINVFRPESKIQEETLRLRPFIWADLLEILNGVVKRLKERPKESVPFRLADLASFGLQILDGDERNIFEEAMRKMSLEQSDFALEENPIFQLLHILIYEKSGAGTYTIAELYKKLAMVAKDHETKLDARNSRGFSRQFCALLTDLERHFSIAVLEPRGERRVRAYEINSKN
jgi:hypothetical protein